MNLGPVDPQFSGIPAIGVIKEIEKAFEEIKTDQRAALLWNPILSRLPPSFVQQCHWAIQRSSDFLAEALREGMFKETEEPERTRIVDNIVSCLTDLDVNKSHNKHFHYQECLEMGLNVKMLETDFDGEVQDLVLTVHHCFIHALSNTPAFKIIENHLGRALVRQKADQSQQILLQVPTQVVPEGSLAAGGPTP